MRGKAKERKNAKSIRWRYWRLRKIRPLRWICGITSKDRKRKLSLGIVWYLMPDEDNNDGKKTSYLKNPEKYRPCDHELFKHLKKLVDSEQRSVSEIQDSKLFSPQTVYHDCVLPYGDPVKLTKDERLARRKRWLDRAIQKVRKSDVVFCDPDTGFEIKSVEKHYNKGGKYVFWDEAKHLYDSEKQTAIFYQHSRREKNHIKDMVSEIGNKLPGGSHVIPITFEKARKDRTFFVIPSQKHDELITARIREMEKGPWADHIQVWRI